MKNYLLDTNICIFLVKGKFELPSKIRAVGEENCFISEITLAELKFGAENSPEPERLRQLVAEVQQKFAVVPILDALDFYAKEKTRLRKKGMEIPDFDLLIGCTAVVHNLIMVTNNTAHLNRIDKIQIEDWTKS